MTRDQLPGNEPDRTAASSPTVPDALAILNVAGYLFTRIDDRETLRAELRQATHALDLRGTVLLAEEGINLFLAGEPGRVRAFLGQLRLDPRFAELTVKESWSATVPFRKMLVRLKKEIIRMDHPTIRPANGRAPAVDAETLRRWLANGVDDDGREVVMLDTRNGFEVDAGAFEGAIDWRLTRFSEFPDAVREHRAQLEGKTVVSYCTGGIRCEKAVLFMEQEGLEHVYQLDDGILGYFERVGGEHFRGDCFVFDERVTVDPALAPAS